MAEEDEHELAGLNSNERLSDAIEQELVEAGLVEAPDGGWGWAIVAASFLANVVVDGIIFTSGAAFQPQWEQEFGASSGAAAWACSLLSGVYLLSGPIASALANIYGCRVVTGIGCLLAVFGFVCSMFAPALWVLYITFGVIGGIGFGLMYLPSIVIVSFYFKKRRALATGLAVCGSGIGTFLFAPLSAFLMEQYSWRQTMLIVAGISLNGLVAASVYRPLKPTREQIERVAQVVAKYPNMVRESTTTNGRVMSTEEIQEETPFVAAGVERFERFENPRGLRSRTTSEHPFMSVLELTARERNTSLFNVHARTDTRTREEVTRAISRDSVNLLNRPLSRMDIFYTGSSTLGLASPSVPGLNSRGRRSSRNLAASLLSIAAPELATAEGADWKERFRATLGTMLDLSLLKSPTFLLFSFCGFLTLAGFLVPFVYLPRYAMAIGHSQEESTFLISILGIANIVFRILCGWLSDQPWLNALQMHNAALMLGGVATMAVPFLQPYWLLVVYCLVFGLATACFASLRSIICAELMGLERLTSSFGLLLLIMGVSAVAGSPIAGALFDATGTYNVSFYVLGATVALSGLLGIPLRRLSQWEFADEIAQAELEMQEVVEANGAEEPSKKVTAVKKSICLAQLMHNSEAINVAQCLATACFASLRSIICAELMGLERLTSSFGLLLLIMGVSAVAGSPIAGALFDATGTYNVSFYVLGATVALSGLLGIPLRRLSQWEFADEIAQAELEMQEVVEANGAEEPSKKVTAVKKSICLAQLMHNSEAINVAQCLATACFASLRSIICAELMGLERLTSSFGLLLLIMGVSAVAGSPIAGALFDATGTYNVSFYVLGATVALSGLLGIPLRRLSQWEFADEIAQAELEMQEVVEANGAEEPSKKYS